MEHLAVDSVYTKTNNFPLEYSEIRKGLRRAPRFRGDFRKVFAPERLIKHLISNRLKGSLSGGVTVILNCTSRWLVAGHRSFSTPSLKLGWKARPRNIARTREC